DFANEPLVVLRRDPQVAARERNSHGALAAFTVGIRPAPFRGRGNAPVAHGDFALVQILDAKGIAESASQLFELENFARIWFFVYAMERRDAALEEIACYSAIGREHKFSIRRLAIWGSLRVMVGVR